MVAALLSCFVSLHALCVVCALLLWTHDWCERQPRRAPASSFALRLQLAYRLLTWAGLCVVLAPFVAEALGAWLRPARSLLWWTPAPQQAFTDFSFAPLAPAARPLALTKLAALPPLSVLGWGYLGLGLVVLAWHLQGLRKLRSLIKGSYGIRRYRRLQIVAHPDVSVPFSFRWGWRRYVVLPFARLNEPGHQRMALAHELQHHRQGDTLWALVLVALKIVCYPNPGAYYLARSLSSLQEFACDEALVARQRFSASAYCRCLLWVAQNAMQSKRQPAGTVGMAKDSARPIFRRRIDMLLSPKLVTQASGKLRLLATLSMALLFTVSLMAHAAPRDRVLTRQQAQLLAKRAGASAGFPLVVNDLVLAELNKFVGTPGGRATIKQALANMQNYQSAIAATFEEANLPLELMAIPIVESRYQNTPARARQDYGAGIWMFIKSTAIQFGLRVDAEADERLDIARETDAAARLLSALHLRFQDWGLALLAYNAGDGLVQRGIAKTRSRDVWTLVRKKFENDPRYVAKVVAAAILMKNQASLE